MKKFILTVTALVMLASASGAYAWGYGGHYGGHHGVRFGYHGSGKVAEYILGGIVLGSILNYAFSYPRYSRPYYNDVGYSSHHGNVRYYHSSRTQPVYREVVTRRSYTTTYRPRQQNHLHRDRHGNCFRVSYGRNGEELRAEQPRSVCNW